MVCPMLQRNNTTVKYSNHWVVKSICMIGHYSYGIKMVIWLVGLFM